MQSYLLLELVGWCPPPPPPAIFETTDPGEPKYCYRKQTLNAADLERS